MTGKDELKRAVCEAIDRNGNEIMGLPQEWGCVAPRDIFRVYCL
jgi:hypothetical protein